MGNNKQNNKTRKQKYRWETHILELSTAQASNATTRLIQTDEIVSMRPLRYRAPTWVLNFHTLKEEAMRLGSAEMGGQSALLTASAPPKDQIKMTVAVCSSVSWTLMALSMPVASLGTLHAVASGTSSSATTMLSTKATRTRDIDAEDDLTSSEERDVMAAIRESAKILRSLAPMAGAVEALCVMNSTELPLHAKMALNFTPKTAEALLRIISVP